MERVFFWFYKLVFLFILALSVQLQLKLVVYFDDEISRLYEIKLSIKFLTNKTEKKKKMRR